MKRSAKRGPRALRVVVRNDRRAIERAVPSGASARFRAIAISGSSPRRWDAPSIRLIGTPKPLSLCTPPPENLQLKAGHCRV